MIVVESNGIPPYEFVATTPNELQSQDYAWRIPRTPVALATPESIPLLGVAGVAVNGLPIFGPNEAEFPDPYGDPVYNGIMDYCLGHTGFGGAYHYHAMLVACLIAGAPEDQPDPIIAYSLDGYPIFGPRGCSDAECSSLITYQSGWEQTGDPSTYAWDNYTFVEKSDPIYLDACNGHTGPMGDYHYHATDGFPYLLGCFHGEAITDQQNGGNDPGGGGLPTCGAGQTMCCGDGVCDGPETADNCAADCG